MLTVPDRDGSDRSTSSIASWRSSTASNPKSSREARPPLTRRATFSKPSTGKRQSHWIIWHETLPVAASWTLYKTRSHRHGDGIPAWPRVYASRSTRFRFAARGYHSSMGGGAYRFRSAAQILCRPPNRLPAFTRSTYRISCSRYACRAVTEVDVQEKYVALLQRSGEVEEFPAGQVIFSEGDEADRMYVVSEGSVSLSINGDVSRRSAQAGFSGRCGDRPRATLGDGRGRDRLDARRDRQAPLLVPRPGDAVLRRDRHARDVAPPPPRIPPSYLARQPLAPTGLLY